MVFSSAIFLFLFLPCVLVAYYIPKSIEVRNLVLLFFSILFYAWGEPVYVILLMISILLNWIYGRLVYDNTGTGKKIWLIVACASNILMLFIFKYLGFVCENLNHWFRLDLSFDVALPIGISFYTFQAMSYVIDVYRGNGEPQKKLKNVALYIALFPQLIAGPIVRYKTIAEQINNRTHNIEMAKAGTKRFILGLAKKVIFANNFALVADAIFDSGVFYGSAVSWLGGIAYSLQILFDFSGYSDMAIGLGKLFGFEFLENFDFPYISRSVTEFWRRWHISLGSWFRDYVYIPLGGNRVSKRRWILNLLIVWMLTGIWHGANWTFLLWGIGYFVILVLEKSTGLDKRFEKLHVFPHIYTMFFVIIGWVIFRSKDVGYAFNYISSMFGPLYRTNDEITMVRRIIGECRGIFLLSVMIMIPWKNFFAKSDKYAKARSFISDVVYFVSFIVALGFIIRGSYSPFIYFNF